MALALVGLMCKSGVIVWQNGRRAENTPQGIYRFTPSISLDCRVYLTNGVESSILSAMKPLTPVEVATLLGISRQAVCAACRAKRLRAQCISGRWLISRKAVKAFEAKRKR